MAIDSAKVKVVGIPVSTTDLSLAVLDQALEEDQSLIVASVNPLGCAISRKHPQYIEHLAQFDWVICDGIGMVIAARRIHGLPINRLTFDRTSLAEPVLQWAVRHRMQVVLVGAKPGVAQRAGELMVELTPGLEVANAFSGYGEDPARAREFLMDHPGCLVVCGMGSPRQEAFLVDLKHSGWSGIGFTCGGFLDQIVENVDYFPRWIDRMHLRFLYRMFKEPRRLWRRYLIDYQVFLGRFVKEYSAQVLGSKSP